MIFSVFLGAAQKISMKIDQKIFSFLNILKN